MDEFPEVSLAAYSEIDADYSWAAAFPNNVAALTETPADTFALLFASTSAAVLP